MADETFTWPITAADLRKGLGWKSTEGDAVELALYATAASQEVDRITGRDLDQDRHVLDDGTLPVIFYLAARATATMWWRQDKDGPRSDEESPDDSTSGTPMGAAMPRKVQGWLSRYTATPGIA